MSDILTTIAAVEWILLWAVYSSGDCATGTAAFRNSMTSCERRSTMNKEDAHIVVAMANHNMNVTDVAHAIFAHRNTVLYHLDKVKRQTGLNPRRFYDLVELVKMAQEVLESGS